MKKLHIIKIPSPIGIIHLYTEDSQAVYVCLNDSVLAAERFFHKYFGETIIQESTDSHLENYAKQMTEFFAGKNKKLCIPYTIYSTPFRKKVLESVAKIPYGQVRTYKDIGIQVGCTGYRAVGAAIGSNPLPLIIPCHRVIGTNKSLGGFSMGEGIKTKKLLLTLEGNKLFI